MTRRKRGAKPPKKKTQKLLRRAAGLGLVIAGLNAFASAAGSLAFKKVSEKIL